MQWHTKHKEKPNQKIRKIQKSNHSLTIISPQTQDVNWTYIRRSEDVLDVFWTSYVRSIYVLCLWGKKVLKAIVKRISNIFLSEGFLHESIPTYSDGLRKSDFHDIITFIPKTTNAKINKSKSRKREIKWFHFLYCPSVKTNAERIFSRLIKKHLS